MSVWAAAPAASDPVTSRASAAIQVFIQVLLCECAPMVLPACFTAVMRTLQSCYDAASWKR